MDGEEARAALLLTPSSLEAHPPPVFHFLPQMDLPDGMDGEEAKAAAAAREPPLKLELLPKQRASTGSS